MKFREIIAWVLVGVLLALLLKQGCRKCPVCPEIKEIKGDTTYVPKQEPVKSDTGSYVPDQKPAKTKNVQKSQKLGDGLFIDEYQKYSHRPYYEPLSVAPIPASDYFPKNDTFKFYAFPGIPDADYFPIGKGIMPIGTGDNCPLQTSTDTQRIADKGFVVIQDLIRGSIIKRTFSYNLSAATPAREPGGNKPRARWYAGVEAIGIREDWVRYAGISMGYQPKKGKTLITIGGGYLLRQPAVRVGIYTQLNRNR